MAVFDSIGDSDTGPLIAFFNQRDQFHEWAREVFGVLAGPLETCEAVLSETLFLLHTGGLRGDPVFEALHRGKLVKSFDAAGQVADLRRLITKYEDLPMSFADACLVRMSELHEDCKVLTTDRHFQVYRRNERRIIPIVSPF